MSRASLKTITALASMLMVISGEASWDSAANVDLTSRFFLEDARWQGQNSSSTQSSLASTVEFRWRHEDTRASVIPYLRWDDTDDERSLIDLREGYWASEGEVHEILVGVNTVFWGVSESRHLVDIINQTDAVADIDGEDKLGQPMINLTLQQDWGLVSAFLLPYFRERSFAGVDGRLRTPLPVDADRAVFDSSDEEQHIDLALRYSHYIDEIDIGLSLFKGTSREPLLIPNTSGNALIPHYDQIEQFGLDLQYTGDAWLWKLEAITREGFSDTFNAAVGGFEYTFYQLGDSSADLGVLLEYQYDDRDQFEPVTLADDDIFAGIRLALNDSQNSTLLAGFTYDRDSGETFVNIEGERRLGEDYVLEMRAHVLTNTEPGDKSFALVDDDYLQLQLSRYF